MVQISITRSILLRACVIVSEDKICKKRKSWYLSFLIFQIFVWKRSVFCSIYWSVFSLIQTEYGGLQTKCPKSVRIWENKEQKRNSECGHFSRIEAGRLYDKKIPLLPRNYSFSTYENECSPLFDQVQTVSR